MRVEGQCHCGQIRYQADVDASLVRICHCDDCQRFSGSAYRTGVPAPAETFQLEGEPSIYVKTAESGGRRVQAFCPKCGTALYSTSEADPKIYVLRVSSLRQKHELIPSGQIWTRSAVSWSSDVGDLPAKEKQS